MNPNVYHVPCKAAELIFSPLRQMCAAVNAAAVPALRDALRPGHPPPGEPLSELAAALRAPCAEPAVPDGPAQPPFLGLILTRGCNMACRYCDFGAGRGGKVMSPALVSQAIGGWVEWIRQAGGRQLDLHFFGGEPFIAPDLVEIAVHRTRALAEKHGLEMRAEATTNGILGDRMLSFVKDHFDAIVLSLDGRQEDHDRHRPLRRGRGSFAHVWNTAVELAASPVNLCVRCCVSSANVDHQADITAWMCQDLRPESVTLEPMTATPESAAAGLAPPDPLAFARHFLDARRVARKFGVGCIYSPLFEQPRHTLCPMGRDTFIVAPDRSVRSCYLRKRDWQARGLDLRIGEVDGGGQLRIDAAAVQRLRTVVAARPRCARCFCRWGCAGGCLVTETPPGHGLDYTDFCRQTRLVQACVLLEQLGLAGRADALLADREAVARLWNHSDDRLMGGT